MRWQSDRLRLACEKASTFGRRDQGQSQAAFAGTGGTGNKHASFTDHDDTCMKIGFSHIDGRLIHCLDKSASQSESKCWCMSESEKSSTFSEHPLG